MEGKKDPNMAIVTSAAELEKAIGLPPFAFTTLRYDELRAAEKALTDVGHRYAVVYRNGKPIIIAVFQVYTLTSKSLNLQQKKSVTRQILGMFLNLRKARMLIAGNALRTDSACFCYDPILVSNREAYETLGAIAETLAGQEDASAVILTGINEATHEARNLLANAGFAMPWDDHVMEMHMNPTWRSLADYTSALSRKYKSRAGKILEAASDITIAVMDDRQVRRHRADMTALFGQVLDRQEFVLTRSGAAYIQELKAVHKDDFEVTGFFLRGKLVAFSSAFIGADFYEVFYVGFDAALNNTHQLYFNILFRCLERALVLRKTMLRLGRTSFDAKASLGAKAVRQDYMMKLRHLPAAAVKWFTSYFSAMEDGQWKLRSPLKETTSAV